MTDNLKFTWAKKADWRRFYSHGEEILEYLNDVVDEYSLRKYFLLKHQVTGAYWDEERGVWDVHVKNLETGETKVDSAEIFVNNCGFLK